MINVSTFDISALKGLRAGDIVSLSGVIYTARDAAHKKLYDAILNGEKLPISLDNAFIYYTGATPKKEGEPFGSCGPTTGKRMDKYTPTLLKEGLKGIVGKGALGERATAAIAENGAVYFVAVGGAGAYYKAAVQSAELIAYPEFLSEAIYKLTVKDFQCVVGIDSDGNSIF